MNLLQWEFDIIPSKVLKEDKAEYIQALVDAREKDDASLFIECMINLHIKHLREDIENYKQFINGSEEKLVDKQVVKQEMVDKWSIKPSLAEKLVDILIFMSDNNTVTTERIVQHFDFTPTTAKRYLRQLTEFGYLESLGGNKNRSYKILNDRSL